MIATGLKSVRADVVAACSVAGRDPSTVELIAVSKTHPASTLHEAYAAGQRHFGESYAQELRDKSGEFQRAGTDDVIWHYIGRIQRNKAKYIAPVSNRIHSLESRAQAEALASRAPRPLKCLLSVNIAGEDSKGGVHPSEVLDRCRELDRLDGIEMVGLMCLPPFDADPEASGPWFAELADLALQGRNDGLPLKELSMGMSNDFAVAIRHGANWIRVGTAIFGARTR